MTFRVKIISDELAPTVALVASKAVCNLPLRKLVMEFSAPRIEEDQDITPPVVAVSVIKLKRGQNVFLVDYRLI